MARSSNTQQDSLDRHALSSPMDHEFSRQALSVQKFWHGEENDNADDLDYGQTWKFVAHEVCFDPNSELFDPNPTSAGTIELVTYYTCQPQLPAFRPIETDAKSGANITGLSRGDWNSSSPPWLTAPRTQQVTQGGSGLPCQDWLQDSTGLDLTYSDATSLLTASRSWQPTFTAEEYFGETDLIDEAPTVPMSELIENRPRSCMTCRELKRKCAGFPLCIGCRKREALPEEIQSFEPSLIDTMFLDESIWESFNRELKGKIAMFCVDYLKLSHAGKSPIILHVELDHLDHISGSQRIDCCVPVVLNPIKTLEQPAMGQGQPLREPGICLEQLDSVVRDHMWRSVIKDLGEGKFALGEREILAITRLFCGYFAMLYDLHQTVIHTQYGKELETKLVALELVYTIGFRLQRLFAELALKSQMLLQAHVTGLRHRNVIVYTLEIVYRSMKKCGTLNWGLSEDHVLHPMRRMSKCLKSRSEYLLSRIAAHECHLSGSEYGTIRMVQNPTLQLSRNTKTKLPSTLIIAPRRHSFFPWAGYLIPTDDNTYPGHSLIDALSCDRSLEAEIGSGYFKQKKWAGGTYERRRYSDVDEATIKANVVMLSIQSRSKCPKASREAPAVLSSSRESRKPGLAHRKPNLEHTAEGNLPCYTAFGDSLDDPFHYRPGDLDDSEYRRPNQWDSGFSDFEKELHSSSIPSIPSLAHGQSIATSSDVCSLRLDNADNHFPSKLLTVENVSKLSGLPKKKRRHLSSCTSSLGGHSATTKTLIAYHKRANPKADPDIRVSEKHKRPKIEAIPTTVSHGKQDESEWSFMRALLRPISNLWWGRSPIDGIIV